MHVLRRRITAISLIGCLTLALAACQPAPVAPGGFFDDFNGSSIDNANWFANRWFSSVCSAGANSDEVQWYRPQNVTESGGNMVITTTAGADHCAEGSWSGTKQFTSGWAQTGGSRTGAGVTKPTFTFRYGRVDVRFKAPKAKGLWPAIWLLSAGQAGPDGKLPYPSKPEIDCLELYGHRPGEWNFNVHFTPPSGAVDQGETWVGPDWSSDFHVLSVDWRPGKITWLVDGVERWSYTGPGVPDVPMYLIINVAAGGWAGPVDPTELPAQMLIDYVRITP